ncbi:MAG: flippase-like domain-containing protein [Methanoregula sp.]|uniref:lysylphosphatidylglycerol synthase transmembrane domain-containing protein n=1 Tax=Methanoregula sp. TaxID=2052170 RepID=UPI0025FF1F17|nr:lysylphosphatidylglycerol synthase transmembrane domain-containing protein [Methanoregula sp.]MCK9631750.1 flippase-like domain-containing protein [Methanoregula sp.]
MAIKVPTHIRLLFGIIIIIILVLILDPSKIISALFSINIFYLIPAVLVYALTLFILSYRWQKILLDMGIRIPLIEAYSAFVGGLLISDVTPGRIGELSRPLLLEKSNQGSKSFLSFILDRSIDLVTIIILGIFGILFIIPGEKGKFIWALSIPVAAILLIIGFWHSHSSLQKIIQFFNLPKLTTIFQDLEDACTSIRFPKKTVLRSVLLTIIAWCGHTARLVIIALSLGYTVEALQLLCILPLVSILSILPLTISGLGLVEGSLAVILSDMGIPLYVGLTIALIDRGITVAFHLLVGLPVIKKNIAL